MLKYEDIILLQRLDKIEVRVKRIVEAIHEVFGDIVTFQVCMSIIPSGNPGLYIYVIP
jgi:hypothetical protein